ncbi:alpha/beta fold hydrolase [Dyella acidiphila]|uniref:Alpha/beta fold hydrolase n=1 Tax=Dyella acidiphila TaxID=2775866 RepID=A0ABR9GD77_9GAMM|nr:alpha/beta fold hydrolase [Dyella acidiphila]MBE1161975.1 alpha/beta fold hydrolase [Dyella acidiphila]
MSARPETEVPFYFGPESALFGLFHASATPARKAVLLCPPLGQDQIRCHRLYRQLAQALAAEGIAVLRFDYYGTGDSAGGSVEMDWQRCLADTAAAANELRARSGVDRVLAFGARLGGSIALASAAQARLAGIVAWDPVLDGRAYVAQLDAMQSALRLDGQRFMVPRKADDVAAQWLGFAISDGFRQQLANLHVDRPAAPMLLLDSLASDAPPSWGGFMIDAAAVRRMESATPWNDPRRLEVAILSHPLIQAVTQHVREAA